MKKKSIVPNLLALLAVLLMSTYSPMISAEVNHDHAISDSHHEGPCHVTEDGTCCEQGCEGCDEDCGCSLGETCTCETCECSCCDTTCADTACCIDGCGCCDGGCRLRVSLLIAVICCAGKIAPSHRVKLACKSRAAQTCTCMHEHTRQVRETASCSCACCACCACCASWLK